jgi:hypothetical protein
MWNKTPKGLQAVLIAALVIAGLVSRVRWIRRDPGTAPDSVTRYIPLAESLLAGRGFAIHGVPDSFNTPLYPLFLAGSMRVTGGLRGAVAIQMVAETGIVLLTFALAMALGAPRWLAVAIAWITPILPIHATMVLTEILATFLLTLFLFTLVKQRWLTAGLLGGCALLTRPDTLPSVLLAAGVALLNGKHRSRNALLFGASLLGVLLPWSMRNFVRFGTPNPLGGTAAQVRIGYERWLDTWADQYPYQDPLRWWTSPAQIKIPECLVLDEAERKQAALALAEFQQGNPEGDQKFATMAREAWRHRPLRVLLLAPVNRLISTWTTVPLMFGKHWKMVAACWLPLLVAVALGAHHVRAKRDWWPVLMLVAGRSVLPLITFMGTDPRFLVECMPECFLLAAVGLRRLTGCGSTTGEHPQRMDALAGEACSVAGSRKAPG